MANEVLTEYANLSHSFSNIATDEYALHCHTVFEVFYFIRGQVSYLVEGKRYQPTPHSVLLLAPGTFHGVRVESSQLYERYALHFQKDALIGPRQQLLLQPFYDQDIYFEGVDAFHLEEYFRSMLECEPNEQQQELMSIRLEGMLSQIVRMHRLGNTSGVAQQSGTVDQIISFLNLSLGEPITLESLSERFFLSKNHLNCLFKQATGTTVRNYLIHKRVAAAHEMIRLGTPASIAAERCGFGDYSAFFRAYKKILGVSPTNVRRGK